MSLHTKKVVLKESVAEALKLNNKNDRQYQLLKVNLHVRTKTARFLLSKRGKLRIAQHAFNTAIFLMIAYTFFMHKSHLMKHWAIKLNCLVMERNLTLTKLAHL